MHFEDEDYVRLYTRDTPTWKALGWEGQTVLCLMMRKVGRRTGELETDGFEPVEAICSVTDLPPEIARRGFEAMVKRGVARVESGRIVLPKFLNAQWASKGDAARKRASRDAQAARDSSNWDTGDIVKESEPPVTNGHGGHEKSPSQSNPTNPIPEQKREEKRSSSSKPELDRAVARVFEFWKEEMGKPKAKPLVQRAARIRARLREGFTVDQLCDAIRNAKNDPFLMGDNDRSQPYDELVSLLRDGAKVEKLLALTKPIRKNGSTPLGRSDGYSLFEREPAVRDEERPSFDEVSGILAKVGVQT